MSCERASSSNLQKALSTAVATDPPINLTSDTSAASSGPSSESKGTINQASASSKK